MVKESTWLKIGATAVKLPFKALSLPFYEEGREAIGRAVALPFNAVIYSVSPSTWKKSRNEIWNDCKNGLSHVVTGEGNDSFCDRMGIGAIKLPIYPIKPSNWFNSWGEIWHDIKNGGRYIISNPPEEYDPPIETTQASKDLGVQITEQGKGKVTFLASRTLTGDIPYLSPEQLDKIKTYMPNVTIFREENKIVIEIDVEKIINDIKDDLKNKGKSPEEIKKLALEAIAKNIDGNLKDLAKITGGEFKIHTDLKLLNGIAEKLYKEYDNQKQSSERAVKSDVGQSSETMALSANKEGETLRNAGVSVGSDKGKSLEEITNWQSKVKSYGSENIINK